MNRRGVVAVLSIAFVLVVAGCSVALGATAAPTAPSGQTIPSNGAVQNQSVAGANGTLELHFIDVGQSSSTLVVAPNGETLLVDTGDWRDDGSEVLRYLKANDVDRIDHLVTSHADADHIGGHAAVIEYYETEADGVGAVYDPGIASSSQTYERYLDAVEEHDVPLYRARANDTIPFGNVETAVLAPPDESLANGDRNENSLVLAVEFGGHEFLLPGDGEVEEESYLVETYGAALDASVLAAGHHGSRTSSGAAFLNATDPRLVTISSAYDSQYDHPHEETLARLANRSIPVYWTATHGDIVVESDGRNLSVWTQRTAPTNASELRTAPSVGPETVGNVTFRRTVVVANDSETNEPWENRSSVDDPAAETPEVVTPASTATPKATPTPTPTNEPTPAETASTSGSLSLVRVHEDASGDEWDNLDDEYLVFRNTGDDSLDLSGWSVRDEAGHSYRFPDGFVLDAGETVTLRTGTGSDGPTDLYWGSGAPVWNNGGDTVVVTDDSGSVVLEVTYP